MVSDHGPRAAGSLPGDWVVFIGDAYPTSVGGNPEFLRPEAGVDRPGRGPQIPARYIAQRELRRENCAEGIALREGYPMTKRYDAPGDRTGTEVPRLPLVVLGVGLGGFVDGIVLHQILQWHHMLSETGRYPPGTLDGLQANTLADGIFHAATWVAVVVGLGLVARHLRHGAELPPGRAVVGLLAIGWGGFNLVEGLINHHLLGIHRVRPDAATPWLYDIGFLGFGALLVIVGYVLVRTATSERPRPGHRLRA